MIGKWKMVALPLIVVVLVAGCGDDDQCTCPDSTDLPGNFAVLSEYFGQPVSPPHHYDYSVLVSYTSNDTITFSPDYAWSGAPIWTEVFNASTEDLEALYELMLENDIFRDSWAIVEEPPVGASSRRIEGIVGQVTFSVPEWVKDTKATRPVYAAIDSLVPRAVWDSLWARRDRYIRDH